MPLYFTQYPLFKHVVECDGIKSELEKIDKVKNFSAPTNITELRSALGLFSYYRKFIKDFSRIAKPILTLLKKDEPFNWENKQQQAFDRLKDMLIKAPILTYPNFDQPFVIYTDASGIGLGAILFQIKENKEHVITYASRSLNPAEKNYSVTDQECLAVVWAIKHFQHYLGLKPFTIITNHSAFK
jgi:RNase H-like domain found in reverse transcriptase